MISIKTLLLRKYDALTWDTTSEKSDNQKWDTTSEKDLKFKLRLYFWKNLIIESETLVLWKFDSLN